MIKTIIFIFCILSTNQINAQKFKKNELSVGVSMAIPFVTIAKYNFVGPSIEANFAKKVNSNNWYFLSKLQFNQFAGDKVKYTYSNGEDFLTLQSVAITNVFVVFRKNLQNCIIEFNFGYGHTNKNTSDVQQLDFLSLQPCFSYRLSRNFEPFIAFHIGQTNADILYFLKTGFKFIF